MYKSLDSSLKYRYVFLCHLVYRERLIRYSRAEVGDKLGYD